MDSKAIRLIKPVEGETDLLAFGIRSLTFAQIPKTQLTRVGFTVGASFRLE